MIEDEPRSVVAQIAAREVAASPRSIEFEGLPEAEWQQILAATRLERVEPQLAAAVADPANRAAPAQVEDALLLHARAMATALLLDRQLLEVAEIFDRAGVDFVVLKGAASAHLDRPDPSDRAYGDVDLLVPAPHIDRAEGLMVAAGGRRAYPSPRPDFDRRFGKGSSFRTNSGLEVDLHRTLALGPFGLAIEPRALFSGQARFVMGGHEVFALDRPRRFLHACYHAVLGRSRPKLVPLLDLVHAAPSSGAEAATVVDLASRWRADAVVEHAIRAAESVLDARLPRALVEARPQLRPTTQQRRWLAGYVGESRSSARLTLTAVEAIGGWHERLDYLTAVLWPSNLSAADATRRIVRGGSALLRGSRR